MMMYIARLYGVLILSAACLVGCGARPALPSLVQLAWQERFGDGYVGYCKAGRHLWLVSSNGLEKFTFERGSRPFVTTRYVTKDWYKVALGPYSTRCQGAAFEAQLSTQTPAA